MGLEEARQSEIKRLEDYRQKEILSPITEPEIVGESAKIRRAKVLALRAAPTDATVLITGETGTGKDLLAKLIHAHSKRRGSDLVCVNCAAIPESLIESELFGHVKGSFTGAIADKKGLFEVGDKGTIFLDEIGEMSLQMQAKLLHVLEGGNGFRKVGSCATIKIDVRIIAASNKNLLEEVKNGSFKRDLYYRLKGVPIYIPPLKKREDDVLILAKYFLNCFAKKHKKKITHFHELAVRKIFSYPWPGNVRELKHAVEYAVIMTGSADTIIKEDLLTDYFRNNGENFHADIIIEETEEPVLKALVKTQQKLSKELGRIVRLKQ